MSYYYKPIINYTSHALQRAKERLNLKDKPDWEVKAAIKKHMQASTKSFDQKNTVYVSASNSDIYFVIDMNTNTLITVTKVSPEKMLSLYGG
ncbi:hypothetical protein EELLY_v1c07570 [Entomoplasma ellychniae]|uniref:Uncharacterized protein n=1 Tax=Entomoplasma ellychniae TaxID=2114 RepID=A0A8E2UAD5_9MOLU|nr:hypothetical protein [Entomoplasma ellychniae]PPE05069.1 hypothetical protein EELLY_v1c07570 [Entomoplasma ellychniae]